MVLNFIYLGSKVQNNGYCDKEVDYRISQASSFFSGLRERCVSRRGFPLKMVYMLNLTKKP